MSLQISANNSCVVQCRFDFSHNGVIEAQRLEKIEAMCRESAQQEQKVYAKEVSLAEAQHINGSVLFCLVR